MENINPSPSLENQSAGEVTIHIQPPVHSSAPSQNVTATAAQNALNSLATPAAVSTEASKLSAPASEITKQQALAVAQLHGMTSNLKNDLEGLNGVNKQMYDKYLTSNMKKNDHFFLIEVNKTIKEEKWEQFNHLITNYIANFFNTLGAFILLEKTLKPLNGHLIKKIINHSALTNDNRAKLAFQNIKEMRSSHFDDWDLPAFKTILDACLNHITDTQSLNDLLVAASTLTRIESEEYDVYDSDDLEDRHTQQGAQNREIAALRSLLTHPNIQNLEIVKDEGGPIAYLQKCVNKSKELNWDF